jgi:hypothetical protein
MQGWVSHYCDGKDFFPKAPLFQMHMVINLFLIMIINNEIRSNNYKDIHVVIFWKKFIHYE